MCGHKCRAFTPFLGMPWRNGGTSGHISKQGCHSHQNCSHGGWVSWEPGKTCPLTAVRLQPLPTLSPEEAQNIKQKATTGRWPQIGGVHIKGMISTGPDSCLSPHTEKGFPGGSVVRVLDVGLIPGSGRSLEKGNGNPLQYSCLENSMDRGAWWTTVHGVTKSQTWLSTHIHRKALNSLTGDIWFSLI